MTVRNKVKEYVSKIPDPVKPHQTISAYRFWQMTGLARATAYRVYNDPTYVPTGDVLDAICSTFQEQPGVFLVWTPSDSTNAA